jgi:hypothetical protein
MNILRLTLLSLLLLTGPALLADPAAPPQYSNETITVTQSAKFSEIPVDAAPLPPNPTAPTLTDAMQANALSRIKLEYLDYAGLNVKEGESLMDLVARSNGGLQFQRGSPNTLTDSNTVSGILTASLPGSCFYIRLSNFTPKAGPGDFDADLHKALAQQPAGVILDLRNNRCVADRDFDMAALLAGLFDKGPLLFSARGYEPFWNSWYDWTVAIKAYYPLGKGRPTNIDAGKSQPLLLPVVVLVNHQTSGAGEVLAATLQRSGALVLGQPTAGRAGVFKPIFLSDTLLLNVLTAKAYLPDGSVLWGYPVVPDIAIAVDERTEKAALTLIKDNQILDVIQESAERHRMSEASLVKGQDPEWDEYLASLERRSVLLSLPVIHDVVLISALDSLKAIRLSQRPSPPAQATVDASSSVSTSVQ